MEEMQKEKGFSIREYASRMRSVNVVNCWPFDETAGEETIKSLLPPIKVQKFTWWLDQLEHFRLESTNNTVHVSENKKKRKKKVLAKGVVKVKSSTEKTKAPKKKRSIVEIFAAAPPVERAVCEEEEEDSFEEDASFVSNHFSQAEIKWGPKGKRNEKKIKKNTDAIKKIKKKKKKIGLSVRNKENCFRSKPQAQDNANGNQSSSQSKEMENYIHPCVSILKRKLKLQNADAYDQKTNYMPKQDGILRNHPKPFSLQQSKKSISHDQSAVPVINPSCSIRKRDKHVTFSDKNNDRQTGKQSSNYSECSHKLLRNDSCLAKTSGVEDVPMGIEKEVDAGFASKKNCEEECISRSESSDKSTLLSMSQNLSERGFGVVTHDSLYACQNSTYRKLKKDLENLDPIFPTMRFNSNDEGLMSHQSRMERRAETLPRPNFSQSTAVNSDFQFQTFACHSPDELLHPLSGNIRAKTSMNGLLNEDFVGLPLNSQGELIGLNPCAKTNFNHKMDSNMGRFPEGRRLDRTASSTDHQHLDLFPVESYVNKQNPLLVAPSRLDITESPSDSTTNFGLGFLKINEHEFHDSDNMVPKTPGIEKIQSTMRLMGKEFTVGRRGFQGFEDGQIWKDKQIVNDPRFGNKVSNITVQDQKFRENLFCPSENTHAGVFAAQNPDRLQKIYPSSEFYNREYLFQPKNQQNLPQSAMSAIRFPFMHPDIDGHTESYYSQRSSVNRPPLCFDVSKNRTHLGRNYSYPVPGDSHLTNSSASLNKPGDRHYSLISPSLTAVMPCHPGILPAVSAVPKRHGNQKIIKEPTKSRIGNNWSNKSDVPFNPINTPTSGFRDVGSSATFDASFQNMRRSFVICREYEADEDERIISPCNENAKIGPIQLSAGAKHILKACQQKDHQSSTRFAESDISLSATTTYLRFP